MDSFVVINARKEPKKPLPSMSQHQNLWSLFPSSRLLHCFGTSYSVVHDALLSNLLRCVRFATRPELIYNVIGLIAAAASGAAQVSCNHLNQVLKYFSDALIATYDFTFWSHHTRFRQFRNHSRAGECRGWRCSSTSPCSSCRLPSRGRKRRDMAGLHW